MKRRDSEWEASQGESTYIPSAKPGELTVIGAGARLDGNLISAASLRIEGMVKGQITAEADVTVAPEAQVDSDIRAVNVTIAGSYKGNVTASGTVELASSARVTGNLSCRALVVNDGAIFTGQSIMDSRENVLELESTATKAEADD